MDDATAEGVRLSIDVVLAKAAELRLDDTTTMALVEALADVLRDAGLEP